ncbi:MAG: winged helix-turn-helix transcriptional regulator [Candidatus Hodarchaeota archaeon]
MLDVLTAKGTITILEFIKENAPIKSSKINDALTAKGDKPLTTATVYRRLKELELVGLILRDPPDSKIYIISEQGNEILTQHLQQQPEITQMRRSHRQILREIEQQEGINVVQLQSTGLSPTTINKRIQDLTDLGLVKQYRKRDLMVEKESKSKKAPVLKPGRPKIRHRLTKKGKKIAEEQKEIEEI